MAPEVAPAEAIDPVCGMTVQIDGALYTHEYEGQNYYFCAAGCLQMFASDPEKYLERPAPSGEAIDPVCGMTVDIASAKYMSEYEQEMYYFCAAGCKAAFDKNPLDYVETAEPSESS
jgi:Cu+-exporting ATPase